MKRGFIAWLVAAHCGGAVVDSGLPDAGAGDCPAVQQGTPTVTSTCGGVSDSAQGGTIDGDYVLHELRLCSTAGPTTIRETLAVHGGKLVITTDATEGDGTRSVYRETLAVSTAGEMLNLTLENACSGLPGNLLRTETINPFKKYAFTATTNELDIYELGPKSQLLIAVYTRMH